MFTAYFDASGDNSSRYVVAAMNATFIGRLLFLGAFETVNGFGSCQDRVGFVKRGLVAVRWPVTPSTLARDLSV